MLFIFIIYLDGRMNSGKKVLKYMVRCNNTQQQMISHYLEKDYKDDEKDKILSQEMISLYVEKVDEEVNGFMRDDK